MEVMSRSVGSVAVDVNAIFDVDMQISLNIYRLLRWHNVGIEVEVLGVLCQCFAGLIFEG